MIWSPTWASEGSSWRGLVWIAFWMSVTILPLILGLQYFVINPTNEKIEKDIADSKAKTKAELNMINNSSCQQLHDKLLSTDHFYDPDNEAIARDHYVANCGVRLP